MKRKLLYFTILLCFTSISIFAQAIRNVEVPTVVTVPMDEVEDPHIEPTEAMIYGRIEDDGGAPVTEVRFSWGTTSDCGDGFVSDDDNEIEWCADEVEFWYLLTEMEEGTPLEPGNTYYYQTWAHNEEGWGIGDAESFTTPEETEDPEDPEDPDYQIMFEESFEGGEASELWEEWDGFVTGGTMEVVQDGDTDWRDVAISEPPESNGYFGKTTIDHDSAATNIWKTGSPFATDYTIEAWIYVPAVTGDDPPDNWFYQYITGYIDEGQQSLKMSWRKEKDGIISRWNYRVLPLMFM